MKHKYRYYSEEYKEMCDVLCIDFVNDAFWILPTAEIKGGNQIEVKGLEKMKQFTGLRDKNGKNIYEGDIYSEGAVKNAVIKYDPRWWGGFIIYNHCESNAAPTISCLCNGDDSSRTFGEVVGNIHQNRELLK